VAVNVALALQSDGYKVGLLDADVYGPSIPFMLAISEKPKSEAGMLLPVEKFGLKILSIGMMLKKGQAIIWRGPLVSGAIRQLVHDVMWGELDYLVVDLPPGTGDPSITIAQEIPGMQVLMVTTPQEMSLIDVRRAVELFEKMKKTVLGVVENMSYFQPAQSAERLEIFGSGGGEKLSLETGIPLLGSIPVDMEISRSGDSGVPLMASAPDSVAAHIFLDIVSKMETTCDS
jgi:ATP-binding protein involved in chromosome partitioning